MKLIILKIKRLAHTPGNCYRAGDRNTSDVATRRAVDVVYGGRHCSGAIFKKLIFFKKYPQGSLSYVRKPLLLVSDHNWWIIGSSHIS